nr:hypothetical protein Iba_chr12aCG18540 [Ipomoea batatas]GMD69202.1 hypothetical protein Iba_chr12dCG16690 [Ipomoea batatas]
MTWLPTGMESIRPAAVDIDCNFCSYFTLCFPANGWPALICSFAFLFFRREYDTTKFSSQPLPFAFLGVLDFSDGGVREQVRRVVWFLAEIVCSDV